MNVPVRVIENERPAIARSLWAATANPTPPCPPLEGSGETEVAIVGGGFTGLSAALHLAERGVACTVLEAETPGWGASGRNGGQVIPGLKHDPDAIERAWGKGLGGRMARLAGGGPDLVFDLIARHGIDCDPVRQGWIQPAHDKAGLKTSAARAADWARRGAPVEALDKALVADLLGTDAYLGGLLDKRGGALHPLNYALGLARAAIAAGATIHGHGPVEEMKRDGAGFVLRTGAGKIEARRVLLCTNGYSGPLHDGLRKSVVPVRSVQVATEPLSDNLAKSILPGGQVASDTRRLLLYFRKDARGRLLMGGRGAYTDRGVEHQLEALRQAALKMFPQLGDAPFVHRWGGFVALTPDHFPHLHEIEPGVMAGLGYNGRGVAMATAMGKVLADWASGTPPHGLDFPVTTLDPIPFHALRRPIVEAVVMWNRLRGE